MRQLAGGIALLLLVVGTGSSARADGSWCAFYDPSTYNCGFYSYEQCYATVLGAGGNCRPNFFQGYGTAVRLPSQCATAGTERSRRLGTIGHLTPIQRLIFWRF